MTVNSKSLENLNEFEKGKSGNPDGKKKGTKNISTHIQEILNLKLKKTLYYDQMKDGTTKEKLKDKTIGEALAVKLVAAALSGDRKSINDIIDRMEGKSVDRTKIEQSIKGDINLHFDQDDKDL